jgi:hypothetical protein
MVLFVAITQLAPVKFPRFIGPISVAVGPAQAIKWPVARRSLKKEIAQFGKKEG